MYLSVSDLVPGTLQHLKRDNGEGLSGLRVGVRRAAHLLRPMDNSVACASELETTLANAFSSWGSSVLTETPSRRERQLAEMAMTSRPQTTTRAGALRASSAACRRPEPIRTMRREAAAAAREANAARAFPIWPSRRSVAGAAIQANRCFDSRTLPHGLASLLTQAGRQVQVDGANVPRLRAALSGLCHRRPRANLSSCDIAGTAAQKAVRASISGQSITCFGQNGLSPPCVAAPAAWFSSARAS